MMKRRGMRSILFGKKRVVPSKIVCVGRNYTEHIEELGNELPADMVIFTKPNSAITDKLKYFGPDTRFEGELCLLIEKNSISGIGFGLDLTHAEIQNRLKKAGLPWERAKAFDNSAVFSRFIPFSGDFDHIVFVLRRNGKTAQRGECSMMIYKSGDILRETGTIMTLEDGDIIMTGTPKGVSAYEKGDILEGDIFYKDRKLLGCRWIAQ